MKIVCAAALALLSASATAQTAARDPEEKSCAADSVEILILGSYHMGNPGLDAVNVQADDVLTPRRQAEIAELNQALLRFRPTKVAVEGDRSESVWPDRYRQWLQGKYQLGRNEIEQIGMKVARAAGHSTIYPIDFPMFMSGLRYDEVEIKKPQPPSGAAAEPAELSEEERRLRRLTVAENLRRLNTPEAIAAGHQPYMELLEPEPENAALYEKSDYLTNWYKRNIRMMSNVARISGPRDRVLLIVGSGHLAILRDFALGSRAFCLADTLHYLDRPSAR